MVTNINIRKIKIQEITYGSGIKHYLPCIYIETEKSVTHTVREWFTNTTTTKLIKQTTEYVIAKNPDGTLYQLEIDYASMWEIGYAIMHAVDSYDKAIEMVAKLDADIATREKQANANTIIETKFLEIK